MQARADRVSPEALRCPREAEKAAPGITEAHGSTCPSHGMSVGVCLPYHRIPTQGN